MNRPRMQAVILMLVVAGMRAQAQNTELDRIFQDQDLESLIDQALQLNITAKVLPPGETPVWNSAGLTLLCQEVATASLRSARISG